MKKSKLFIASIVVASLGVLGILAGASLSRIDMIVFYLSIGLAGTAMFLLDKEKQAKRQQQAANNIIVESKKGLKNWQIIFIAAGVLFVVALLMSSFNKADSSNDIIPTSAYTEPATEALTEPPTEAPTEPPTEAPTEPSTEVPTEAPTEPSTEVPTEAPTEPPTEAPTENTDTGNNFNTYNNVEQQNTAGYVLNTSTMKVHKSSCGKVKQISPDNIGYTDSLDWAFNNGYDACGICNPY